MCLNFASRSFELIVAELFRDWSQSCTKTKPWYFP